MWVRKDDSAKKYIAYRCMTSWGGIVEQLWFIGRWDRKMYGQREHQCKIPENSPCEQWPRNRCFYDKRLEVSHFMQEVRWWSYSQSVHSKNCFTDYHNKVTRTRNQAQKRQIIHFYIMPLICCLVEFVLNLSCWWVKTYPLVIKGLRGNTIHLTMCSCPRIPLEYIWCRN